MTEICDKTIWSISEKREKYFGKKFVFDDKKMEVVVSSPNVKYSKEFIESNYSYAITRVEKRGSKLLVSAKINFLGVPEIPRLIKDQYSWRRLRNHPSGAYKYIFLFAYLYFHENF